jgi:hypothetical protein
MHASLENWKNNWFGLSLELQPKEIDRLIALLQQLKATPEQHFHVSSDYKAEGGLGSIEISVNVSAKKDNMFLSGVALAPGDELPHIALNPGGFASG